MDRASRHLQECPAELLPDGESLLRDQALRWEQGEWVPVETFFDRYPSLKTDRELVVDLICNEILLRAQVGELLDTEEYLRRFSDFFDELHMLFEAQ